MCLYTLHPAIWCLVGRASVGASHYRPLSPPSQRLPTAHQPIWPLWAPKWPKYLATATYQYGNGGETRKMPCCCQQQPAPTKYTNHNMGSTSTCQGFCGCDWSRLRSPFLAS
ncbi:hypothetical protein CI102_10404 [Trichoderma harzianum]|nr:hypothetical protein CI102_10404 [Trichoderma harzianum]